MLTSVRKSELRAVAVNSLNSAERIWNQVGYRLLASESRAFMRKISESVGSQIPGYPTVELGKPKVDQFIAIVADMRGSTDHLLCAISAKKAKVSQLQRVFYETAALLPSLAKVIQYKNGNVTEYLGDGILGLFCVDEEDPSNAIYAANSAATHCIDVVQCVVNPLISERYSLPPLHIGIGLAYSKAVVTLVGLPEYMQPKVFGECVFRASKLACGRDEVLIDEALRYLWPKSKNGIIRFQKRKGRGKVEGYLIERKQ